ncbi:hypothetical protein [Micromonospora carbonacea]|uniref:hypothetical protein n=1 Tax=Micromonospora carbonacea TaxID=47853 RepID=UPI0018291ABF|nr:hypothetical protein [Micromonospora carbonacea]
MVDHDTLTRDDPHRAVATVPAGGATAAGNQAYARRDLRLRGAARSGRRPAVI